MSQMTRRDFLLRTGACAGYFTAAKMFGPLHSGLAWAASSCVNNNKVLVHLFLDGGMDSASLLIPRNIQAYMDRRPNIRITNPLVIDNRYGLHPSMTRIYNLMAAGKCAVINKVGYPNSTRSHEDSKAIYARALRNPGINNTGWAGRFGDTYCVGNPNVSSVFSFRGSVKEIAARNFVATTAGSLSGYGYSNDSVSQGTDDSRYRRMIIQANRAVDALSNDQQLMLNNSWGQVDNAVTTVAAVAAQGTNPDPAIPYGNDSLSARFRDAARLIASNERPSIILLSLGGFDTHDNELASLTTNFGRLDQAIGAFWADITRLGRENDVTVQVFTEFGRNTFENGTRGTDHGFGTVSMVFGSPNTINAGVWGPDYTENDFANRPWLNGDVDFREVMSQAMSRHLGVDPSPIFPEPFSTAGVPVYK